MLEALTKVGFMEETSGLELITSHLCIRLNKEKHHAGF